MCIFIVVSSYSQEEKTDIIYSNDQYIFPYEVNDPDEKWQLPNSLDEISGLSYIESDRLACVQDEKGNIYVFNILSGEVERKIDFGDLGDYEGVEIIDDDAWALKSSGTLYEVKNYWNEKDHKLTKFNTVLSGKNDAEGLAYDPVSGNLLIACKGHPYFDEKKGKEFKAIYEFDLRTKKVGLEPFLLIVMDTIKYYKNYNTMAQLGVELLAFFDSSKGDISFQPSGISIHPATGNIYVIASVGNLLMVFSRDGDILSMVKLKSEYHPQPEGICFSPDGTLFISNEADGDDGTILMFETKN
jgi:uncharacterized protein YjiK